MAPPAGPRPGWSRRAQYSVFFSFIATVICLCIGLVLLALSIAAPQSFQALRGAGVDLISPISRTLSQVTATVSGLGSGAGNYWDAARQNAQLRRERNAMAQQLTLARAIQLENRELRAALQLRERTEEPVATGRIVSSSFQSPRRFAVLDAGLRDGINVGMPVRSAQGLVGRILDAGQIASRVLLVSDRANIVPGRLLRGGQPVIIQGRGDGSVDLKPLEVGKNPFRRGDVIVTSGVGGLYRPMVPVARVIKLQDDGAIGLPIADPGATTVAIVERPYEPAASDSAGLPDPAP